MAVIIIGLALFAIIFYILLYREGAFGKSAGKCSICGRNLLTKAPQGSFSGSREQVNEWLMRTAFSCENCGTRVCRGCATVSRCPKCGEVAFVNMAKRT